MLRLYLFIYVFTKIVIQRAIPLKDEVMTLFIGLINGDIINRKGVRALKYDKQRTITCRGRQSIHDNRCFLVGVLEVAISHAESTSDDVERCYFAQRSRPLSVVSVP